MGDSNKLPKDDREWRDRLAPEQYRILRQQVTEAPGTGKYLHEMADGMYRCAACAAPLFSSAAKFDSGTGWPSFSEPAVAAAVELRPDTSHGMVRTEVICQRCGSHLGHVFAADPSDHGGKHYCINSAALDLKKR
jgi:peptide-methionine (R)-S-oxide reductase